MRIANAVLAAAALAIPVFPCEAAKSKVPEPTGLELQQIQSRDFEAPMEVAFPAVMTVLQDAGYRINAADKATGLITAQASTDSTTSFNLIWGFGKKKATPVVSAFVEGRGPQIARIRLNFVMAKSQSRFYGFKSEDEEPIVDPAVYRDAFEKIDKEIFVRLAMSAPTPAASPNIAGVQSPSSTESSAPPPAPKAVEPPASGPTTAQGPASLAAGSTTIVNGATAPSPAPSGEGVLAQ